jgi:hypothetical protein
VLFNQSLRQRDKIKDDAISQLSDQRMTLTRTRMLKKPVRSLTNAMKYEAKTSFLQEIVIKKNPSISPILEVLCSLGDNFYFRIDALLWLENSNCVIILIDHI